MSALDGLERLVAGALQRAGYSGVDASLVVAVSGGPDSVALVRCLYRLRDSHRLRLHLAHLNHNFRGEEAYADARFVGDLAQKLGLDATVEERDVLAYQRDRHISSFEQAAREIRYAFLAEVAESSASQAVVTGHTADDVAETVLLHILRGTGIHGLRGMSELSPWPWPLQSDQLKILRPLLRAAKTDTLGYCHTIGQEYRSDSGNDMPRFTRNRVRHQLLPQLGSEYNPKVRESLLRLARIADLELDYMEGEVARLWPQVAAQGDGAVDFDRPALASLHPALQKLMLRQAYSRVVGNTLRLEESHLDAMAGLTQGHKADGILDLPGGFKLHRSYDQMRLSREDAMPCPFLPLDQEHSLVLPSQGELEKTSQAGPWQVTLRLIESSEVPVFGNSPTLRRGPLMDSSGYDTWSAYLDREALDDWLRIRVRQPGDRFQPLGMEGMKKLQDFFTDERVPRGWRDRVPLLVAERGIAWVVGYRIANWARVENRKSGAGKAIMVKFVKQ